MAGILPRDEGLVTSFVPPVVRLAGSGTAPEGNMALLWLDIVDSSRIGGQLAKSGPHGPEQIAALLNTEFDAILSTIVAHGGQAMMFAGDAVLAGWRYEGDDAQQAVARAASCGLAILNAPGAVTPWGEALRLHAAIGAGPCQTSRLGNDIGALYVTVGRGLADLQAAFATRAPGQLLLSTAARQALGDWAELTSSKSPVAILTALRHAPKPQPLSLPPLSPAVIEQLEAHVPLPVARRLQRRLLDWSAELRRITVIFAGLADLDLAAPDILADLERIVATVGPIVRRYDGFIYQLRVENHGANLLIYFGIPPIAHADDPVRAVRCAVDLRDALRGQGRRVSLGVATGRVLCGLVGNDIFREFAIFGDPINRAARLQSLQQGMIQCDEATVRAARGDIDFIPVGRNPLRGLSPTAAVWTPRRHDRTEASPPMQGRDRELGELQAALDGAVAGETALVTIEADSGMGKSRLLAEIRQRGAAADFTILFGGANTIESRVPFRAWREVIAGLLDLYLISDLAAQRSIALAALGSEFETQAALLNAVLPLDIPETAETLSFAPSQRERSLFALLLALLRRGASQRRTLVTLDDMHWADEGSWALVEAAARDVAGICLVLALQPIEDDSRLQRLQAGGGLRLRLGELGNDEQEKLVLARLGAQRIVPELAAVICARARGHPFFCSELAQSLLDEGLIEITGGTVHTARDVDLTALPLPETVHGAVTRRIDRLDPDSQITLKVASAAGLRFPARLVSDVHPVTPEDHVAVGRHLDGHHRIGLLHPERVEESDGYSFRHGAIRDVAYELMVYAQRRRLHREIAAWYERVVVTERSRIYTLLAHHLEAAEEPLRAADYLRLEAEHVFRQGLARQSVDIGLHAANLLGITLPRDAAALQVAVGAELERIATLLGSRAPQDLVSLPTLADPRAAQIIGLLLTLAPFAFNAANLELYALLGCTCLRVTLEHGNGPFAADVYAVYSVVWGALTGDRVAAASWSKLGLTLQGDRRDAVFSRCAFVHAWFHAHWIHPLDHGIALVRDAAEAGLRDNEVIFECFSLSAEVVFAAASGRPLPEIITLAHSYVACNAGRVYNARHHLIQELQFAKALSGLTAGLLVLGDTEYDEALEINAVQDTGLFNQIGYYFVLKTKLHVLALDWTGALQWADRALPILPFFTGQTAEFELAQYRGLASLATAAFGASGNSPALIEDGRDCIEQLRGWERRNPNIFAHKADLLDGLLCAALGDARKAARLLDQAAARAAGQGFRQDAAIARENLARILRAAGDAAGASEAAAQARARFAEWGAQAKVAQLTIDFSLQDLA
jgi:predicted ATPase/class 3 adenylate cyclase